MRNSITALGALLFVISCLGSAPAQQPTTATNATGNSANVNASQAGAPLDPAAASAPPSAAERDNRYRIGPGDVLDVRVFNLPQLSRESVRVDNRGFIRMPLVKDDIQAACRTEAELAATVAQAYLKYQKHPNVDVFVRDYQSRIVAVIGAVNSPGRFQLQRPVRLLELLTFAGGPNLRAGRSVQIVHSAESLTPTCEAAPTATGEPELAQALTSYRLNSLLQGEDKANPFVQAGDVITIAEAEQAFIVGNVLRPQPIVLNEPVTLTRAIAMAGGLMPDTKKSQVKIIRQTLGSTAKTEITADLVAINKRQAEDVMLQSNDIIEVPTEGGIKGTFRSITRILVPTVATQLPLRVIP